MTRKDLPVIVDWTDLPTSRVFVLGEAVEADGSRSFWLLTRTAPDGGSYTVPRHEHHGPLPFDVLDRLRRCGARTHTTGQPCRRHVATIGKHCPQHTRNRQPTLFQVP